MLAASVAQMIDSHRLADQLALIPRIGLTANQILAEIASSAAVDTPIITISVRDRYAARAALLADSAASTISNSIRQTRTLVMAA